MARTVATFALSTMLALVTTACGPAYSTDDGNGEGEDSDAATLTGVVWAPGNAPGMVAAGHEIPVFSALVYVSRERPEPIPQQTYCEECVEDRGGVLTDHQGAFSLPGIAPGDYWLVVEKGQFRRETQIVVDRVGSVALEPAITTLPSVQDPASGQWIPRVALASGSYDGLETILGKLGLGSVDAGGNFIPGSAAGKFDVYANGGSIDDVAIGSLAQLAGDLDRMLQYHIIFIPCSASEFNSSALRNQTVLTNLRQYVAAGGKLYVTDWSGEWSDNVFPAQVKLRDIGIGPFGGNTDTPASAWNQSAGTWDTSEFGNADGLTEYDSDHAEAVDADLHTWLGTQQGPKAKGAAGTYSATDFAVTGNYNYIDQLNRVDLGVDGDGVPIVDEPRTFLVGDDGGGDQRPLTVTFEPAGCGRVLYSTYHTTDFVHAGLVPQERVLVYLIMEIGLCHAGPVVE